MMMVMMIMKMNDCDEEVSKLLLKYTTMMIMKMIVMKR